MVKSNEMRSETLACQWDDLDSCCNCISPTGLVTVPSFSKIACMTADSTSIITLAIAASILIGSEILLLLLLPTG